MDDPLIVRRLERGRDLMRDLEGILHRHRAPPQPRREVFAVDELHDERADGDAFMRVLDAVQLRDIWMVQGGERLRLAHESLQALGISGKLWAQKLQRDIAIEPRVVSAIHLAHATRADRGDDAIRTEGSAGLENQTAIIAAASLS